MKLEKIAEGFRKISRKIILPLSFPIILAGCGAKEFFKPNDYNAQINIDSEGSSIRLGEGNDSFESDVEIARNESTIEGTNSKIEEKRFTAEFNIHCKNKMVISPVIETIDRTVTDSSIGQISHLSQDNLPFLAVGVQGPLPGDDDNFWRARPYVNPTTEETIAGNFDVTKFGLYLDALIETMYGNLKPLMSYTRQDVVVSPMIWNPSEFQIGASWSNSDVSNFDYLFGAYFSSLTEDDRLDPDKKTVLVGDLTGVVRNKPIGISAICEIDPEYDYLFNIGVHGSIGGNSDANKKALTNYIRNIQELVTERGLPKSVMQNRAMDALRDLEQKSDAPLFYMIGIRNQHDISSDEPRSNLYLYVGFNFRIKDKKMIAGLNYGNVFPDFSNEDLSVIKYGGLVGMYLVDNGLLCLRLDHRDNETTLDKDLATLEYRHKILGF